MTTIAHEAQALNISQTRTPRTAGATAAAWTARIVTGIVVAFLLFDGVIKLFPVQPVVDGMTQLGYPVSLAVPFGVILLSCLALYVFPRTAVLGAILLTGYLGGAVATHVRVDAPLATHILFPIYVGVMLWGGLYLRDARLRALIPFRAPRA